MSQDRNASIFSLSGASYINGFTASPSSPVEEITLPRSPDEQVGRSFADYLIGGVSRFGFAAAFAPLDTVEKILNVKDEMIKDGRLPGPKIKGAIHYLTTIAQRQGCLSLWRDFTILHATASFIFGAVTFGSKNEYRRWFNLKRDKDGYWLWSAGNFAAGATAGATIALVGYAAVYLYNYAKRDGMSQESYNKLAKPREVDRFSLIHRCVAQGIYFGVYDSVKPLMPVQDSFPARFMLGWGASVASSVVVWPMVTVGGKLSIIGADGCKFMEVLSQILKDEGIRGLYKGLGWHIRLGSFAAGGALAYYDTLRDKLFGES